MSIALNVLRRTAATCSCKRLIRTSFPVFQEMEAESNSNSSSADQTTTEKEQSTTSDPKTPQSFAKLLRNSTFMEPSSVKEILMQGLLGNSNRKGAVKCLRRNFKGLLADELGDPEGKIVVGEIFLVVDNDLYIDFGWKFHTVCQKPKINAKEYTLGSKVLLQIKDLELSTKFLGDDRYINLLEADCNLLTVIKERIKKPQSVTSPRTKTEAERQILETQTPETQTPEVKTPEAETPGAQTEVKEQKIS